MKLPQFREPLDINAVTIIQRTSTHINVVTIIQRLRRHINVVTKIQRTRRPIKSFQNYHVT